MRVRLLTCRVGASGTSYVGDEIDLPKDEAMRLVKSGQAELVRFRKREKAVRDG